MAAFRIRLALLLALAATSPASLALAVPAAPPRVTFEASLEDVRAKLAAARKTSDDSGDPNYLITFDTRACGVRLAGEQRRRNPQEITIVLQYQFANLVVTRRAFAVDLWFSGRRQRVNVPFEAISAFYDKDEGSELKFEPKAARAGCANPRSIRRR